MSSKPSPAAKLTAFLLAASILALTCLIPTPVAAQSPSEMKPIVTVVVAGHEEIFSDIDFLGGLAGNPHMGQQLQGMVGLFTGNQGLAGIDGEKPFGVIVQSDGLQFAGTGFVPVTNLDSVLNLLQMFNIEADKRADETYEVRAENQTLFFKHANNWALIGLDPDRLHDAPANPEATFGSLVKEHDIAIQALIKNVPEQLRQMALMQLQAGMQAGMQPLPNENQETFQQRQALAQAQMDNLVRVLDEMEELKIGIAVAAAESRIYLDILTTAQPGTKLATQMSSYEDTKTDFAGFYQPDAAFMITSSSQYAPEDAAPMIEMLGPIEQQLGKHIDEWKDISDPQAKETLKAALADFLAAARANLQHGKSDGGAILFLEPDALAFVAGSVAVDTERIESGLKQLGQVVEQESGLGGISWNAHQHANVRFHTFELPLPPDEREQAAQLFGDKIELAVGIGEQEVYVGAGRDCLARIKEVIDASRRQPGKAVPPMELSISLTKIMETASTFDDEPMLAMIADMLRAEAQGKDHVRIVAQPVTHGLRVRIELEDGALKAIGQAASAARNAAVGAGL